MPGIDTLGLVKLFPNKGLGMMVESIADPWHLIYIRREREKVTGKILEGSRKTNPVGIKILSVLALVVDSHYPSHSRVPESYGFPEA